ncbi:MAG: hypothetical protein A2V62_09580 [Nitrospirae bacterium RBG_19FT_COMBO_58_9]|nr:MAG: hypothetical protein A2V62_09580 [Nitrospirae bacterium RBG_19FT_COMBO_58_9]
MGTDKLPPEVFVGVGRSPGDGRFRLDGKRVSALIAEFGVFLILLLALRTGFHPSESITMRRDLGKEAARV